MNAHRLLVTGAAGFIGSRVVRRCQAEKIDVISVDHLEHFRSRGEHRNIDYGQLVDRQSLVRWIEEHPEAGITGILHLGACTDTTEMDVEYFRKMNVQYSKDLWAIAAKKKIPFIYASSAATYGEGELGYSDEEALMSDLRPLNPYGESKLEFDLWALDQEKHGHTPPSWSGFKFFNVYGFGEKHKTKMSSVVIQAWDQIRKSGKVRLFKSHREGIPDGHQKRDFIYVDDVVNVLFFALKKPIQRGIFNLGSGQARTFLDLTKAVFAAMNQEEIIEFFDTPEHLRERYQYFTEAKMERLRKEGYDRHFTALEDGVEKYIRELDSANSN